MKCRACKQPFERTRPLQIACSLACALIIAELAKAKKQRAEAKQIRRIDKERKEKLKIRSDYIKEAQIAFNAYIRERDRGKPCICCGNPLDALMGGVFRGGSYDAGHYRSVGSASHLRFDERNVHGQRKFCNQYGAGRAVDYRMGLIKRIGLEAVEALEADNTPRKWTISELKAIKEEYKDKLKSLLKQSQDLPHD